MILAVVNGENHEVHLGNNKTRNTISPKNRDEYKTQVPEEVEGRVANKLSPEFSQTKNRIL